MFEINFLINVKKVCNHTGHTCLKKTYKQIFVPSNQELKDFFCNYKSQLFKYKSLPK